MASNNNIETVGVLLVGAAAIALLLSRQAQTSGVIKGSLTGLSGFIGAAIAPSEGAGGISGGSNQSAVANPNASAATAFAGSGSASPGYTIGSTVTPQNVGSLIQQLSASAGSGNPSAQAVLSTVGAEATLIQGGSNNPGAGANTSTSIGGGSVGFSTRGALTGAKVASVIGSFGGPVGTLAGAIVGALFGGVVAGSTGGTVSTGYTGEQTYGAGQTNAGNAYGAIGTGGNGFGAGDPAAAAASPGGSENDGGF